MLKKLDNANYERVISALKFELSASGSQFSSQFLLSGMEFKIYKSRFLEINICFFVKGEEA